MWLEHYACVFAADRARYDHVRLAPLLQANTTVDAWVDKAFTMPANHPPIFLGQSYPRPHGDSPRNLSVVLRQLWFFADVLFCQFEERVNSLQCYVPSFIHLHSFPFMLAKEI